MPSGEDAVSALRAWMTHEVSRSTERQYDLGKFLFTVSIGSAGVVASLAKANKTLPTVLALVTLLGASAAALVIAWPRPPLIGNDTDLLNAYSSAKNLVADLLLIWLGIYVVGLAASVFAIGTFPGI